MGFIEGKIKGSNIIFIDYFSDIISMNNIGGFI